MFQLELEAVLPFGREKWNGTKRGIAMDPPMQSARKHTKPSAGKPVTGTKHGKTYVGCQEMIGCASFAPDWFNWLFPEKTCFFWLIRVTLEVSVVPAEVWKPQKAHFLYLFLSFQITSWGRHKSKRRPSLDTSFNVVKFPRKHLSIENYKKKQNKTKKNISFPLTGEDTTCSYIICSRRAWYASSLSVVLL